MFDKLILKFYCGLFVLEGNRSLSTSVTMQLCCLALAYVCVSLGACVYLFFDYIFPLVPSPPPSISSKLSYPYIFYS